MTQATGLSLGVCLEEGAHRCPALFAAEPLPSNTHVAVQPAPDSLVAPSGSGLPHRLRGPVIFVRPDVLTGQWGLRLGINPARSWAVSPGVHGCRSRRLPAAPVLGSQALALWGPLSLPCPGWRPAVLSTRKCRPESAGCWGPGWGLLLRWPSGLSGSRPGAHRNDAVPALEESCDTRYPGNSWLLPPTECQMRL